MMNYYLKWGLFVCLIAGCSSQPFHTLLLEQDSSVRIGKSEAVSKKKGDKIEADAKESILIEAPGFVPLLIPPSRDRVGELSVALTPFEVSLKDTVKKQVSDVLDEVVSQINNIQVLISKKQLEEAVTQITALETKYPSMTYFKFLKASCYVLLGKNEQAISILNVAIKENPDNKSGKAFYDSLTKGAGERVPAAKGN